MPNYEETISLMNELASDSEYRDYVESRWEETIDLIDSENEMAKGA